MQRKMVSCARHEFLQGTQEMIELKLEDIVISKSGIIGWVAHPIDGQSPDDIRIKRWEMHGDGIEYCTVKKSDITTICSINKIGE